MRVIELHADRFVRPALVRTAVTGVSQHVTEDVIGVISVPVLAPKELQILTRQEVVLHLEMSPLDHHVLEAHALPQVGRRGTLSEGVNGPCRFRDQTELIVDISIPFDNLVDHRVQHTVGFVLHHPARSHKFHTPAFDQIRHSASHILRRTVPPQGKVGNFSPNKLPTKI